MPVSLSRKQARTLGLLDSPSDTPAAPRQKRERNHRQNMPAEARQKPVARRKAQRAGAGRRLSYEAAGAAGWWFLCGPFGVMAWRHVSGGGVEKTGRYLAGEGERIDQQYRPALDAIQRGDYEKAEQL